MGTYDAIEGVLEGSNGKEYYGLLVSGIELCIFGI